MPNTYNPVRNGFAQSSYKDQQGTALAGSLAFASDKNLVDAFIVGDVGDDGLEAGLAVIAGVATDVQRTGLNEQVVTLPATDSTAADIAGIVVRNQQMRSNATGHACYFAEDVCNVVRTGRSGGRVWVQLADGAQPAIDGAVYVHTDAANAGKFATASGASTVAITTMKFKSAAADGIALVELM
ncbi:structural cement protein Gp24 [Desulfovibrio falkowii]|uniref:structural cement protein Gp24 n=4 Tax=unclassified Desulfovibrio TaxID=2593640 RepID=UPI00372CF55C